MLVDKKPSAGAFNSRSKLHTDSPPSNPNN